MSDNATPNKPKPPRYNHLQAEPVPISFASPQQLAAFTAGGGFFNNPRMKTPMSSFGPPMNTGFTTMNNPTHQPQTVQPISPSTPTASASSKPVSSNSNVIKSLGPQEVDASTFKGFKFITLDQLQLEAREVYEKISGGLNWVMCEGEENRCISVIRDECANRRVFLVSSGSLGARIVPQIHEFPQVYAIYIYCLNVKAHQEWAVKYNKVRVVCDNDDRDLLPRLAVDVGQSYIDWGNALLKAGTKDKAQQKFQLAYDRLNDHVRNHDPAMDVEIRNKQEECK